MPHSSFSKKNRKILLSALLIAVTSSIFMSVDIRSAKAEYDPKKQGCDAGAPPNSPCKVLGTGADGVCVWGTTSGMMYCAEIKKDEQGNIIKDEKGNPVPKTTETEELGKMAGGGFLNFIFDIGFWVVAKVLMVVTYIVWTVFGFIVQLAGWFLDAVLDARTLQIFTNATIVKTGWTLARDLANMFFALILMVISFATILRIEQYGVKNVIAKLITAALLINFSLVIAGVAIDFSQVLTKYFVEAAKGGGLIGWQIMKALNIQEGIQPPSDIANKITGMANAFAKFLPALILGIVVMLITAFTMFAGGILLIIRVIALWFLLILAPLAWLFYILPATHSYWKQWWSTFFKWVFFAPAYTFFLYLAVKSMEAVKKEAGVGLVVKDLQNTTGAVKGIFNYEFLINYVILIGLLLGGLIVAKKMGIWGAGAMLGAAAKIGKSVQGLALRKGAGYDRWAPTAVNATGAALRRVGFKKTGGILQGKSLQMRERQMERPEEKAYMAYLKTLPPLQLQREFASARGKNALSIARTMKEIGGLPHATPEVVTRVMDTFRAFGQIKEVQELEEMRPDAIADAAARNAAIQRAILSGAYKRWAAETFQGVNGPEIMRIMQTQLPPGEFINAYKGWSTQVKQAARNAMEAIFTDNPNSFNPAHPDGQANLRARNLYASATGNINTAFAVSAGSPNTAAANNAAETYIRSMTAAQISNIAPVTAADQENLRRIGDHITRAQVVSVRGELSSEQKRFIMDGIMRSNPRLYEEIISTPALSRLWT